MTTYKNAIEERLLDPLEFDPLNPYQDPTSATLPILTKSIVVCIFQTVIIVICDHIVYSSY
jgi:hypothetical protein